MNYRETPPTEYKDLTSNDIISFFEDEQASEEDIEWFKTILDNKDNQFDNNFSRYNWAKIKLAFAERYFPEIVINTRRITVAERLNALFNR